MPPSPESAFLTTLFQSITAHAPADNNTHLTRALYTQVQTAGHEHPAVSFSERPLATLPALWAYPAGASSKHILLFMHGGGFTMGSPASHRKLFAHLAHAFNCVGVSIEYRLTPEVAFPVPLDDCVDAYAALLREGFAPGHVVLAGDSCGGGLVASVCLAARERGLAMPGCGVALSPWMDMTFRDSASLVENRDRDVLGTQVFMDLLVERYLGGGKGSVEDPLCSPVLADLKGLPPLWVSCAGDDMLRDDGVRFAEKAREHGVEVVLEVHEGMQHVFEFMVGRAPEADGSVRRIGQWVKGKLGTVEELVL